jgi:hypothetical protein
VGYYINAAGAQAMMAEQKDGSTWTIEPTAIPTGATRTVLSGVSCPAAALCIAVGDYVNGSGVDVTLAEEWNGSAWAIQPTPNPGGASRSVLSSVSCSAAGSCIAVGSYVDSSGIGQTLSEQWNGSTWGIQPTANPTGGGGLTRVSCSAPTACTALGQASGTTLVERWNGVAWTTQTIAIPTVATRTDLYGVTCTRATLCTAVGHWSEVRCNNGQPTCNGCWKPPFCTIKLSTLAERWNGSGWVIQATPGTGVLSDVSCPAASACIAVGDSGAELWNGTAWTALSTAGGHLSSVSCTAAATCTAAGQNNGVTLAEGWNGSTWAIQPTPTPNGPANSTLSAVSCANASACTAVGKYVNASGQTVTLAEYWDGTGWAIQPTPNPTGPMTSSLSAVSCARASACTAVGAYFDATVGGNPPPDLALAEGWTGTGWAIHSAATPGAGYQSVLSGVSCPAATVCMAVGYDYGPQDGPLAEEWNGITWSLLAIPAPSGVSSSRLSSASCAAATACVAVGFSGLADPLAEDWNGTSWTVQPTPVGGPLSSVSCPAVNVCLAVGGLGTPVADEWNGTTWTSQVVPLPAQNNGGELSSVSCTSAADCTAVGHYTEPSGPDVTLAEHWDGAAWTIEPTPNPATAIGSYLTGVSCPAPMACTAVGQYQNTSNMQATLVERYS